MSATRPRAESVTRIRSNATRGFLWPLFAAGVPFVVSLFTMAPTVWWLDSAELTTGAYTLGIVHAPGAPLFLSLGHLFATLPVSDVRYLTTFLGITRHEFLLSSRV